MRPRDSKIAEQLRTNLKLFNKKTCRLIGIQTDKAFDALIGQFLESIHRVEYISLVAARNISILRADPASELFDPLKAAILFKRQGQIDESCWLVFLFVHFGKNKQTGWDLARSIYGRLNSNPWWNWQQASANPSEFRKWLQTNRRNFNGHFGNHRKYQSLDAYSASGTGSAVESYVRWVHNFGNHEKLFQMAKIEGGGDPKRAFDCLYNSMDTVMAFGRTGRFDYLTMIGKLGLSDIKPGSAYLNGATGPVKGAQLLFGDYKSSRAVLDKYLIQLDSVLGVGMQVIEDALCNWQKSPNKFLPFRG